VTYLVVTRVTYSRSRSRGFLARGFSATAAAPVVVAVVSGALAGSDCCCSPAAMPINPPVSVSAPTPTAPVTPVTAWRYRSRVLLSYVMRTTVGEPSARRRHRDVK
jgi:hypothetical protein